MAYSINPNLPKARAFAMKLLIMEQLPLVVVARKCGVHRSTIWRWKRKWDELNKHVKFTNPNRPNRPVCLSHKLTACRWQIATISSRPYISPHAINERIVARILELRCKLKRCAEVIWHHIVYQDGIKISLNSVRRILRRHHCFDGTRKKRVRPDNPRRPKPTYPGELVQTDTIHHVDPYSGRRLYFYTVIDLYSRMTYVKMATKLKPGLAAIAILEAQTALGFKFSMVQSDNGLEFGRYFEQELAKTSITTRHSRLGRPNDNAHVERFNRTLQEECIGHYWRKSVPLSRQQTNLTKYLDYYNNERIHLGLQMRTPAGMLQRS